MAKENLEPNFDPVFQFAPEEDDDWREEKAPVEALVLTGAGDWIKPVDSYHSRGADYGQIERIQGQNVDICWISDGLSTSMFIGDVRPIQHPDPGEIAAAKANARQSAPSACVDRIDARPSRPFNLGDLVMTRSIMCRHGVQLGVVIEQLPEDRYQIEWHHVIGTRPKDSRTSYQPKSWRRCQLLSAESTWHQLIKPTRKSIKGLSKK